MRAASDSRRQQLPPAGAAVIARLSFSMLSPHQILTLPAEGRCWRRLQGPCSTLGRRAQSPTRPWPYEAAGFSGSAAPNLTGGAAARQRARARGLACHPAEHRPCSRVLVCVPRRTHSEQPAGRWDSDQATAPWYGVRQWPSAAHCIDGHVLRCTSRLGLSGWPCAASRAPAGRAHPSLLGCTAACWHTSASSSS